MEPRKRANIRKWIPLLLTLGLGWGLVWFLWSSATTPQRIGSADVPKAHADGKIHIHDMNKLTSSAQAEANREQILILTPLARFYEEYWKNLLELSYPHDLIDLGFIVPNNKEGDEVLKKLDNAITSTQQTDKKFHKITVLRQDTPSPSSQTEADRHAMSAQKDRRRDMALARNSLLFTTIQSDTAWIFWLDSDVVETPATILQDMTKHNKDVLVANCFQRFVNDQGQQDKRPYDYNSWVDSETARNLAAEMGPDDILLEGYAEMATWRTLMAKLYHEGGDVGEELELDGVGGTALLVRSDVHRDGAMFPPFAYYHLIETEGFARMVKRLGYEVWGLPNYLVFHYNE